MKDSRNLMCMHVHACTALFSHGLNNQFTVNFIDYLYRLLCDSSSKSVLDVAIVDPSYVVYYHPAYCVNIHIIKARIGSTASDRTGNIQYIQVVGCCDKLCTINKHESCADTKYGLGSSKFG